MGGSQSAAADGSWDSPNLGAIPAGHEDACVFSWYHQNPKVAGSNPAPGTAQSNPFRITARRATQWIVERQSPQQAGFVFSRAPRDAVAESDFASFSGPRYTTPMYFVYVLENQNDKS